MTAVYTYIHTSHLILIVGFGRLSQVRSMNLTSLCEPLPRLRCSQIVGPASSAALLHHHSDGIRGRLRSSSGRLRRRTRGLQAQVHGRGQELPLSTPTSTLRT